MTREKFLLKITEKWSAKILSVAAAVIIAIFYRMSTLETRSLTVPLVLIKNENLVPVSSFTKTIKVNIRGEANIINSISEEDIEAYIDLTKYTNEGSFNIPVQIQKSGAALGLDLLEISVFPAEMRIMLEQNEIRNIPVYPVFEGTIAHGFEIINQSVSPVNIIAEGPRSSLNNQYEFTTDTIDLDGRHDDFSVLVYIINNNPLITLHGDRMIEYNASVRPIKREYDYPVYETETETESEDGDSQE